MKRKLFLLLCALLTMIGVQAQKDVTSTYITNATLSDGTNGWTKTHTKTKTVDDPADAFSNSVRGNNTVGYATEAYAGWGELIQTAYSMKQTITLPAGNYRLVCYAFFRQGDTNDEPHNKASKAYLRAGDQNVLLQTLRSINATGYANNQAEGANCFDSKMYRNVVEFTSDGSPIEIGVDGTFDEKRSWCIVGQFELFDLDDLASVSSPTDVTYAITNPGFEYRDLTGWSREQNPSDTEGRGSFWYMDNTALSGKAGIGWVESYKGGGIPNGRTIYQDLTGLDNGLYEVTVYGHLQQGSGSDGFYLYANSDKVAIGSTDKDYSVRTTVTDGNLRIKLGTESCNGNWAAFDKVRLLFYGDPLAAYQELLDAAVEEANDLIEDAAIPSAAKTAWRAVVDANDNDDRSFTEESQFSAAIGNIENANTLYLSFEAPYASFNALKTAANAIAAVAYTGTTDSHTTFAGAITAQTTAADGATTVEGINTATSTLKAAIKTYINAAEPKNEGEYFDITCLIENPTFENNNATGWTGTTPNAITYGCAEFFNMNFDFYQNLTGLANGSYQLSVQAYCRPGGNGNLSDDKQAYYAYTQGINNVTAELYVNSDASRVGNIYAYTGATSAKFTPGDWKNDYECEVDGGTNYFVPNCMEGASKFFADEEVYKTDVAALVEDGNLKIGFREASKKNNQWVIFDNFRLYYYGSSKLVYYKQYLPQLRAEAAADLANGAYANVLGGSEDAAFQAALEENPAEETEEAYKAVIDNIVEKQTAFCGAKSSYDAFTTAKDASAITKISDNIGAGVFQYDKDTNDDLYNAYDTRKDAVDDYTVTSSSTASAVQTLVDALNEAIDDYNNQPLNAPAADTRYYLTIVEDGKDWNGKAVTFIAGGRDGQGDYAIKYNTTPNDPNKCQALKFTAVAGEANTYKVSAVNLSGGEQYLTTGTTYDGNNDQIRTTDDASKAMKIKIEATSTENQFQLRNVAANKIIANNNNDDMYTANSCNFTIAEASQAEPNLTVVADVNWATFMSPFAVELSSLSSVEAYTVTDVDEGVTVMSSVSEGIIPANTPVLLYRATTGSNYKPELSGWGTAAANTYDEGLLTGSYVITYIPANSYALQKKNGKVGFYKVSEDNTIQVGANRAYLTVPGAGAREAIFFEEDVTGINTIGEKAANTLQDLLNGADVYDLSGRKVNGPLEKGKVYIVNGNKIYVK